jgi:hypothetical protein
MCVRLVNRGRCRGSTDNRPIAVIRRRIGSDKCGRAVRCPRSLGNRLLDRRENQPLARVVPSCQPNTWAVLRRVDSGCDGRPATWAAKFRQSTDTRIASLASGR